MTHDAWQISLQMPSDGGENKMKSQQIDISSICCHGQQLAISFPFWSLSNAHTCAMPLANKQPTALENLMKHSVHMTWIQMKKIPSNCQTFKQTQNTLTPNYHNFQASWHLHWTSCRSSIQCDMVRQLEPTAQPCLSMICYPVVP